MLPGILATLTTGLLAGAAIYATVVEHPARMRAGSEVAARQFPLSYRRAALMQAPLATVGLLVALIAWAGGGGAGWLVGAGFLAAVIAFTVLVIVPTNKHLLDDRFDPASDLALALLQRWGRLHAVRSALSLAAHVSFVLALAAER